ICLQGRDGRHWVRTSMEDGVQGGNAKMLTLEILIPIAWLIVVAFVVAMCSVSARSDHGPDTLPGSAGWIKVGALGLRGGVPEDRASGESRGENPELLVRQRSGV